jgi:hypothetical protein
MQMLSSYSFRMISMSFTGLCRAIDSGERAVAVRIRSPSRSSLQREAFGSIGHWSDRTRKKLLKNLRSRCSIRRHVHLASCTLAKSSHLMFFVRLLCCSTGIFCRSVQSKKPTLLKNCIVDMRIEMPTISVDGCKLMFLCCILTLQRCAAINLTSYLVLIEHVPVYFA